MEIQRQEENRNQQTAARPALAIEGLPTHQTVEHDITMANISSSSSSSAVPMSTENVQTKRGASNGNGQETKRNKAEQDLDLLKEAVANSRSALQNMGVKVKPLEPQNTSAPKQVTKSLEEAPKMMMMTSSSSSKPEDTSTKPKQEPETERPKPEKPKPPVKKTVVKNDEPERKNPHGTKMDLNPNPKYWDSQNRTN
eukprot:8115815-Karenia_brevis.AAC.1